METQSRARRGFTLVELAVVMAVLAILSTAIIGFTTLTSHRVKDADARADFMDACTAYRLAVTRSFAEVDTSEVCFTVGTGEAEGVPVLEIGTVKIPLPEGGTIDALTLTVQAPTEDGYRLLRIEVGSTALGLSESFVIASHCGATFQLNEGGGA